MWRDITAMRSYPIHPVSRGGSSGSGAAPDEARAAEREAQAVPADTDPMNEDENVGDQDEADLVDRPVVIRAPHDDDGRIVQARDRKAEAQSMWHLMTHSPKNEHCDTCKAVKLQRRPARRATASHDVDDACEKFGDVVSTDHIITSITSDQGFRCERYAVVIIDRATRWIS